jgi:hypothetical protein
VNPEAAVLDLGRLPVGRQRQERLEIGAVCTRRDLAELLDEPPANVPTSDAECTNGGWRAYPQFKTQGDCISFVQNGG